jgi:hypothetical protein
MVGGDQIRGGVATPAFNRTVLECAQLREHLPNVRQFAAMLIVATFKRYFFRRHEISPFFKSWFGFGAAPVGNAPMNTSRRRAKRAPRTPS